MFLRIRSDLVGNWQLSNTQADKLPLDLHVLAKLGTIWCTGGFSALISERFRKNMVARCTPGFGQSPNPGQASVSKPREAPSRLAWVHSPGLDLSAGGLFGVQQSKAGGWGGCILLTPFAVLTLRFYSVYLW